MDISTMNNISSEILKLIAELDEFKGQWRATQSLASDRLDTLKQVATIESIGSSTRIEGAKLDNKAVERLLLNRAKQSFTTRDEQEVAGYGDAMEMIFSGYEVITLTENHLKQLHSTLLKYSTKDERHRGEYKKVINHVEAFSHEGKSIGIVFETATPYETPFMMKELIDWFNQSLNEEAQHPLILIGIFIVTFLAIHPFKDGNGRLSRVLTTLLLLRTGYSYVPYSSMESIIENSKDAYYLALRRTQKTIRTESQDWAPWITYLLKTLKQQKTNLLNKIKEEDTLKASLPALSRQIIELLNQRDEVSVKEIEENTGANRNTIKAHLKKLTEEKYLAQFGKGRGTTYRRKR
jgi:Fic family protein